MPRTEPKPNALDEAARITAHLQRFAADPAIPLFLYRPESGARRVTDAQIAAFIASTP